MSSSEAAIQVMGISKHYEIYSRPHDRLKQFVLPKLRRIAHVIPRNYFHEFWALRNVSFDVRKGETIGIVGRNGSGKSTLLQIICGILEPSAGRIQANGRIAALLELGSGFNPDFTGRENVYLNAALLGLTRDEVDSRFDEIAAFASIGDFIEQPVKIYSSGMMVRLAFAVAINVDPQILIVDEALSVGDERFQRKCFSRIEAIKNSGATILFVSHSSTAVIELCDRALLLDNGEFLAMGRPKSIVGKYQKLLYAPEEKRVAIRNDIKSSCHETLTNSSVDQPEARSVDNLFVANHEETEEYFDPHLKPQSTVEYESNGAVIRDLQILNSMGKSVNGLKNGRMYRYTYTVTFTKNASNVRFGMLIKTISGVELEGCVSAPNVHEGIANLHQGTEIQVEFRFQCNLNAGTYFLNAGVVGLLNTEEVFLHRILDGCMFRVQPDPDSCATGHVDLKGAAYLTALSEGTVFDSFESDSVMHHHMNPLAKEA